MTVKAAKIVDKNLKAFFINFPPKILFNVIIIQYFNFVKILINIFNIKMVL